MPELYINQMTPSSLFWKAGGLHVLLDAAPFSPKNRLQATIGLEPIAEQPRNLQEAVIKLRVPMWAVAENSSITITHGNVTLTSAEDILPGAFVSLRRRFESGMITCIGTATKLLLHNVVNLRLYWSSFLSSYMLASKLLITVLDSRRLTLNT